MGSAVAPDRSRSTPNERQRHLLVFDGVCAFCHAMIRWTLRHDRRGLFAFAPLQGAAARGIVVRHPSLGDVDSIALVLWPGSPAERILVRSDAIIAVGRELGGIWGIAARFGALVPGRLRDAMYDFVAARRYRIFGRYEQCPLPPASARDRFLE